MLTKDLVIKKFENHVVILNPNIPSWISLSKEGYDAFCEISNVGIEKYSYKHAYDIEEVKEFFSEIEETLTRSDDLDEAMNPDIAITIFLTTACNFRCRHCFYSCGNSITTKPTTLDFDEHYINFMRKFVLNGGKHVTFTGGEPLLNKNIKRFISHAKSLGLKVFLLTNGSLLSENFAEYLYENNVYVQVSLDGDQNSFSSIRTGGNYYDVTKGISNLDKFNVKYDISFMPSKINIDSFRNVLEFAVTYNANQIHMPFFEEYGSGSENSELIKLDDKVLITFLFDLIDDYFKELRSKIKIYLFEGIINNLEKITKKEVCSVGIKTMCLYSDGTIYPCSELINDLFKLGYIYEENYSFDDIKNSNIVEYFSNLKVDTIEKCENCEYKYYCGGGCRVHANLGEGSFEKEDGNCTIIKALYDKILDYISRRGV